MMNADDSGRPSSDAQEVPSTDVEGVPSPEGTPEAAKVETADAAPAKIAAEAPSKTAGSGKGPKSTEGPDHRWYIVHTYSGFENKVKETLRQRVDALGMTKEIGEILIPSEEVVEVRDGRKKKSVRKFFPGYLLVNMNMTDPAWHVVKNTPKVTGFVGTGTKPVPLQDSDVQRIVKQIVVASE